jgi:O-antigen/teichoic acid export membrane protein
MKKLLLWIQKYTKTDMNYLVGGSFWLLFSHFVQILSGLVMAIAFANLLSKTSYGTYQTLMSIAAILGGLTINMSIPVKRAAAQGNDGSLRYGFKTQLLWSTGIFIIASIISGYYFYNDNLILGKSILLVGALSPFIGSFSLYRAFLLGKKEFKTIFYSGFLLRPVLIVTMLIAVYFTDNPFWLITVYFVTYATSTGLLYRYVIARYKPPLTVDAKSTNYGKHLSVLGIINNIGNHLDKLFIFHFLGPAPVAVYSIAMLPAIHMMGLYKALNELVFPKFAKRTYDAIKKGIPRKISLVIFVSIIFISAYIVAAPFIYKTIFPLYPEAVFISQIAVLAVVTKFGNLFTQSFYVHEMKRELYIIRTASVSVKAILLAVLIPMFGLLGAVSAWVSYHIFWALLSGLMFFIKKETVSGEVPEEADLEEN